MNLGKMKRIRIKNLRGVNLRGADLRGADLRGSDLKGVNLRGADLRESNLTNADLTGADLREVDLSGADLTGADLTRANLRCANLIGANLRGVNLTRADLKGSDLRNAILTGADLKDIKIDYMTVGYNMACPEKGEFIGYKKANGCLVELLILEDSKRSSATTLKCRCDKAKVLEIEDIKTGKKINSVTSEFDGNFIYTVGEVVKVDDFDDNRWNECTTGIHFFMNKENAINF